MNKRFRKLMASLVALLMTFSFITASAVAADKAPVIDCSQITVNQGISDFVTRLYDICLGRNPDPTGFKTWTEQLSNGENTGVGCAYGFIFSNEFQNKNVSNDQYIELMYNCFFGRASDPEGRMESATCERPGSVPGPASRHLYPPSGRSEYLRR